jgi:hypothetical protein
MPQVPEAYLVEELALARRELAEALERQAATDEVLRVISSSSGELEAVFQAILTNAVRICGANFGDLYLREADGFRMAASHNAPPAMSRHARGSRYYARRRTHRWAASPPRNNWSKSPTSRPYRPTSKAIPLFARLSTSPAIGRCWRSRCSKMIS